MELTTPIGVEYIIQLLRSCDCCFLRVATNIKHLTVF